MEFRRYPWRRRIYRIKYDEHFFLQLLMALKQQAKINTKGRVYSKRGKYEKQIFESLEFNLTKSQIRVLRDIREDLSKVAPICFPSVNATAAGPSQGSENNE